MNSTNISDQSHSILLDEKSPFEIFVYISIGLIALSIIGIAFLAAIWLLYFLSRVRELSRKIHYLKKQTDERCEQELTNARVDYIKSIFIAAICLSEVLQSLLLFSTISFDLAAFYVELPDPSKSQCVWNRFFEYIRKLPASRGLVALEISSFLIYTSLVHILTSYLSNAYAEKRIIKLTKRELLMFLLLLTQLVMLWSGVFSWRAFLFDLFFVTLSIVPIHLYFYVKYSLKLYSHLKRRTLDAWFEDRHLHKRLEQMCKEYKSGTVLYTTSILLFGFMFTGLLIIPIIKLFLEDPCVLNQLINSHSEWLHPFFSKNEKTVNLFFIILEKFLFNILAVFATFFTFLLHASILYQAVRRLLNRRRAYNSYTGIHSHDIYKPLIGNK